jgi:hypothetical protein
VIVSVRQAPPLAHATVPCYEEVFVIHIGVSARVRHSSASYELAAEVGEVGDHAAPDQVGGGQEASEYVSDALLRQPRMASLR